MPFCAFAQSIEVTGQLVIAPISSDKCEALAITSPTNGLPSDSNLLEMLTSFWSGSANTTCIEQIKNKEKTESEFSVIYDVSGRKLTTLQQGLNIVIDKDGNRRKIFDRGR